jgi:hypothetical protein
MGIAVLAEAEKRQDAKREYRIQKIEYRMKNIILGPWTSIFFIQPSPFLLAFLAPWRFSLGLLGERASLHAVFLTTPLPPEYSLA